MVLHNGKEFNVWMNQGAEFRDAPHEITSGPSYTELEYLRIPELYTNGLGAAALSVIDTITNSTVFDIDFMYTHYTGYVIFGSFNNPDDTDDWRWFPYSNNWQILDSPNNGRIGMGGAINLSQLSTYLTLRLGNQYEKNVGTGFQITSNANNKYSNNTGPYGFAGYCEIRGLSVYEGEPSQATITHEFIPVLDENGQPCLYDKLTDEYKYPQDGVSVEYEVK